MKKVPKNQRNLVNEEGIDQETGPSINWNEILCGLGSVILTYCILLYLSSYSKTECPM